MKAPDAFRTISEVAEELELPQHVLRFWETRFNQIKPMKRGGGRRYYRPEDVDLLRGIRLLLYGEGFTIRGVQRLLKDKGVAFVAGAGKSGSVQTVATSDQEPSSRPRRTTADRIEPQMERRAPPPRGDGRVEPFLGNAPFAPSDVEEPDGDDETEEDEGSEEEPMTARIDPAPAVAQAHPKTATPSGPTIQNRRRLEFTLADLEEAKRLLDQVR